MDIILEFENNFLEAKKTSEDLKNQLNGIVDGLLDLDTIDKEI